MKSDINQWFMYIRVHKRSDLAYDCCAKTDLSTQIPYYLEEENNRSLNIGEMKKAINEASPHCEPRGLVLINPGNPTGETYVCNHSN